MITTANIVEHHQATKMLGVDEDNSCAYLSCSFNRAFRKSGCGHEDALLSLFQTERTIELSNGRRTDLVSIRIAFGLNIDLVNAKRVLVNNPINSVVARLPNRPSRILGTAATCRRQPCELTSR